MTLSYFGVNAINRPLILLPVGYDGQNIASARQKKSAHSTVRQRHFLRRFNHHRAKLGHAVIGNT